MATVIDDVTVVARADKTLRGSRARALWLSIALLIAVVFWSILALPFLTLSAEGLERYEGERGWILVHVGLGTIALLAGPVQLWLGFARQHMVIHRAFGRLYVATILVGAFVALRLALTPSAGLVFGAGLGTGAVVWAAVTLMAVHAIRRRRIVQHQEWMVRSYVVTFSFVFFRLLVGAMQLVGIGSSQEQLALAAWLSWSPMLVVTEVMLQSRKLSIVPCRADPASAVQGGATSHRVQ